ncbi:MAG: aldo/keto reductase [Bacteroidota bacterium]
MTNTTSSLPQFSPVIVGTMRFGSWGAQMDRPTLEKLVDACVDLGLYDFDLADIYGDYTEEAHLGEVLKGRKDLVQRLRLTTKCGIKMLADNRPSHRIKSYDSTGKHILQSVDQSLQDLGVEQIEILLLHRPDYLMDPHEVSEVFTRLQEAGKVKFFGVSNFSTSQFSLLNSLFPLVTNQVELSLLQAQALDDGTLDQCFQLGIQPTVWSPFGGGALFGETDDPRLQKIKSTAESIGERHQATIDQVLLAWIFKHPSRIVPIVGSTKISRIASALKATEIQLTHEEWYELLEAAKGHEVA